MTKDLGAISTLNLGNTVSKEVVGLMGTIHAQAITTAVDNGISGYWAGLPELPPPPPPVKESFGFDVSRYQSVDKVRSLVQTGKYDFGVIKASEGRAGYNPLHDEQVSVLRAGGLRVGHYHLGWCNQDPLEEARNFLANAKVQPGDCVFADAEDWDSEHAYAAMKGVGWDLRLAWWFTWTRFVREQSGAIPFVYLNWEWLKGLRGACNVSATTGWSTTDKWARLTSMPLWLAQYRGPGDFDTVSGFWPVEMQQYTTNGGTLDENWVKGPTDRLWDRYCAA